MTRSSSDTVSENLFQSSNQLDDMEGGHRRELVIREDRGVISHSEEEEEEEEEEMLPSIWESLNEDLQDRVLAWLPFHAFAQARTVCKRWSNVLKSSSFLNMYTRVPLRSASCFLMFDAKDWSTFWLYNPFINRWHSFPFQFHPSDSKFPCAAAGGLVCFCGVISYPSLFVCNPMTKQWRELPPMNKHRFPNLVGMVIDESSKCYKVVVAGDYHGENARSTEVFDSRLNRWVTMQDEVPLANLTPRNACCTGYIFWLTGDPHGLIAFNIERGTWSRIRAPMPAFLTCPHLVGCTDRLLMVAGVKKHVMPKSIRIWELNLASLEWKEVGRMPNILCKRFLKDSYTGDFMCVGQDEFLCLTSYKCSQTLMYDVQKKIWQWLPSCPFLSVVESHRLHIGLSFCPRWDVSV